MKVHVDGLDIEIEPVSPLIILRSVLEAKAGEPRPPVVTYTMPDGEQEERENFGDPAYKVAVEAFHTEVETFVRVALIRAGVSEASADRVLASSDAVQERAAAHIKAISIPTEGGIQAVMGAAEALFVEGVIAARWADMRLNEYWGLPIDMQNLLIGARRQALGEQISLLRPRGNNGLGRNGAIGAGGSGEEGVASGVSYLGPFDSTPVRQAQGKRVRQAQGKPDGLPGIPADKVGELT